MIEQQKRDLVKVAKGAGISLVGVITGSGLLLLCQVFIARFFGAEVFGLYMLGITVLKMTELLARFGLHMGALRFISIHRKESPGKVKGVLITAVSASFLNGVILGSILYVFAGTLSEMVFHKPELQNVIKHFALCIPFFSSMMVIATSTQGFHTSKYAVYIRDIIQPTLNILLILLFAYTGLGISSIVYSFSISYIVAFIAGVFFLTKVFPDIKNKALKSVYNIKELIVYSAPLVFTGFLHFFIAWTDTIMLGIMKGSQDVGIYKAASQMPLLLTMILGASNSIYAPVIADLFYKGEKKRMEFMFKTTTWWVYSLVLPTSLIFVFSAREIMSIFGTDFIEKGIPVLVTLTIAQFVNCITGGVGFTLTMTGKQKLELINSLVFVLVNILLNFILIPRYNAFGAAVATAISTVLINIIRIVEVYKLYQIHPYSRSYLKTLIPTPIAIVLILGISLLNLTSHWSAILNTFVVGTTFLLYVKVVGFNENERYILGLIKQKFNRIGTG